MVQYRSFWLLLGVVSIIGALMAFQQVCAFVNSEEPRDVLVSNNDMIEGRIGEWLSNGTWRVRVSKVESISNPFGPGPGYAVTIEFRNLTKQRISLHGTGFDAFQLLDDKGNKLSVAASGDYPRVYNDIFQADGITMVLKFGDTNNQLTEIGQPDKLLILFRPWGGKPALPGFRIFLKGDALPSEGKQGENAPPLEGKREGDAPPPEGKPGENVPPPGGKPGENVPPSEGKAPPSGANAPPSEGNVPPSGPSEEGVRAGQAPNITGFEPDQVLKGGSFTILGSNFGTQEGKIVVLGGHGISVDLRVISWSDTQIVVELPNDPQVQEGQRYYVGIQRADHTQWLSNIDRTVSIRGTLTPRDDRPRPRPEDRPRIRPGDPDPSLRTGRAPNITGIEHGGDCVPEAGSLTILGSNFGTREARVTLEGHGISVDLRVISWSDTRIVVEVPDDSRIRPGLRYDVRIRPASEAPGTVSAWQSNTMPITICIPLLGWADLHAHPASHLAFGGGLFHGSPGMGLRDSDPARDMPECSPDKHAGFDEDPVRDELRKRLLRNIDAKTGVEHGRHGPPSYENWPHSQSLVHQQMHVRMIRRAYEAGLRVMIASVTDNQVLEKLYARTGFTLAFEGNPPRDPDSQREFDSAVRQIQFIREFVRANSDWMQIVRTPQEARDAIRNNKLAIILGVEMDSLSVDQIVRLIDNYDVRSVIPIHLADNPHFGGAAVYDDAFNTVNWFINNSFFTVTTDPRLRVRLGLPHLLVPGDMGAIKPEPVRSDPYETLRYGTHGFKNARGLTNPDGIKRLMQKGILLDIAHMSERTTEEVLRIAESFNYPLINSHSGLRDREERAESERAMMRQHAERVARLGGVLGFGTEGGGKTTVLDTAGRRDLRRDEAGRVWRFGTRQLNRGVLRLLPMGGQTDRFVLSVRTGGDNLDSGYGFGVFIRLADGRELFWDNVNRNEELPGYSVRSFILTTASATQGAQPTVNLGNLREIELRSRWDPEPWKNVEWDIMDVRLEAFPMRGDPVDLWLRGYRDATSVMGQGTAFGTDFNGFAPQIPFSRGRVSYPIQVVREVRIAEGVITRESPYVPVPELSGPFRLGTKSYDFSRDGLAHYGMFPELLQDLWNRGAEGQEVVRSLFRSAERLIRAWEGAWRAKDHIR